MTPKTNDMNENSDKPSYKLFMRTNGEQKSQDNQKKPLFGLSSLSHRVTFFLETIFYRYRYGQHWSLCEGIKTLNNLKFRWGKLVTSWPKVTILSSLVICAIFTSGMVNWYQEMDQEVLWTPFNSPVTF